MTRAKNIDELIEDEIPLVRSIANAYAEKFASPQLDADELFSVGCLALVEAARKWRPADHYDHPRLRSAHFWRFVKPRVVGAMIDQYRWGVLRTRDGVPAKWFPLEEEPATADNVHGLAETIEMVELVHNTLGADECRFFVDHVINGLSLAQCANLYGIKPGSIFPKWRRIVQAMRSKIDGKRI